MAETKYTPKSRVLKVTLTIAVRDMDEDEYAEAMEGVEYDPEKWIAEHEVDPRDVVSVTDAGDYRELIEGALDSETNAELFAGTGIFAVMGSASIESIEWAPPK